MPSSKQQSIKNEVDELFHLSVRSDGTVAVVLDQRFDVFPVALTSVIAKQIEAGYSDCHNIRIDKPSILTAYSIWGMEWIWPQFSTPRTVYLRTHGHLGFANLTSLNSSRIQGLRGINFERADWVQLAPSVQALNPQFNHLHSLRVGDVGWGFDREGCVSIATVREADGFLYKSSVYVQKNEQILQSGGQDFVESSGSFKRSRTR